MTHRLAKALPDCRAEIIPEARHMLSVERPEAFADCLTTFIGFHGLIGECVDV